jgi:hypothetical protein
MSLKGSRFSDLIGAVERESDRITQREGIVHRYLDVNAPSQIPSICVEDCRMRSWSINEIMPIVSTKRHS